MGRPPIGKVAMTNTERSSRYRAGLAAQPAATKFATKPSATKPATKLATKLSPESEASEDQEIAKLKARMRELEAELAHARSRREAEVGRLGAAADTPKHHLPESRGAAVKEDTKLMKLIRRLDSPNNDNEAVGAVRELARELQAREIGRAHV